MNPNIITVIGFIFFGLFVQAIFTSSRRLASFGYGILAFGLVFVLGMVSTFFLVPSHASVMEINSVLDMIAGATTIGGFAAAVWAAYKPPRRVKA